MGEGMNLYERQVLLSNIGRAGQLRLQESAVLIVGLGGLGCPVAQYLAVMGIGRLGLIDGDLVEACNLHRQILYGVNDIGQKKIDIASSRLNEQNPDICIEKYGEFLNHDNAESIIKKYDLVVDGSDNFYCRYLVNDACVLLQVPFVSGAIDQFEGQVSVVGHRRAQLDRRIVRRPGVADQDVVGQLIGSQHAIAAVDDRSLDNVFQLADVARPRVGVQRAEQAVVDSLDLDVVLRSRLRHELASQRSDVWLAIAQRSHFKLEHAEPVIQVGTKAALLDKWFQIEVAGDDQPRL